MDEAIIQELLISFNSLAEKIPSISETLQDVLSSSYRCDTSLEIIHPTARELIRLSRLCNLLSSQIIPLLEDAGYDLGAVEELKSLCHSSGLTSEIAETKLKMLVRKGTVSKSDGPPAIPPHTTSSPHLHTSSMSRMTPSKPPLSTGPGAAGSRMDRDATLFIPRKVVIKNESGQEVHFDSLKRQSGLTPASPVIVPSSPARRASIRIETEEAKQKRLAVEERVKKEAEDKVKREADEKQRKQREEEEKKKKAAEEAERVKKEAEKERLKKEEEEKERLRKEEEDRLRKEAEEKERAQKEAAEKEKAALALVESTATIKEVPEEGEVDEAEEAKDTFKEETKEKAQEKAPLRIDTAVPSLDVVKKRPVPLDLSSAKQIIVAPLPSALATARNIDDLNAVQYPEGIKSPLIELNINARDGKFRYDREFLLQFMQICKEKPDSLRALDAIGLEPSDQSYAMTRGGSGSRQGSLSMGPPPSAAARQASVGLGISGFTKPVANPFTMGQFATQGGKMSRKERFAMANRSASNSPVVVPSSPARRAPIRIETEEVKQKRLAAEERVKKEAEDKVKREADEKQRKQRKKKAVVCLP